LFSFWILSRRFAIWIALGQSNKNRVAPLCSKWKQVFFMITSLISLLSSAPLRAERNYAWRRAQDCDAMRWRSCPQAKVIPRMV
jgi:hypothetical protein